MGWLNNLSEGAGKALGGLFGLGSSAVSSAASVREAAKTGHSKKECQILKYNAEWLIYEKPE